MFGGLLYLGIILNEILWESNFQGQWIRYPQILLKGSEDFQKKIKSDFIIIVLDLFWNAKTGITSVWKGQ